MKKPDNTRVLGLVLKSPRQRVEGLETVPGDAIWLGLKLSSRQERAFLGAGLRPAEEDDPERERIVLAADVALYSATVMAILEIGRKEARPITVRPGGDLGAFLAESEMGRSGFLAGYLPPGVPLQRSTLDVAPVIEMDPAERPLDLPVPHSQFGADVLHIPLSDHLIFPMGHWMQVLWANLLGLGPFLWRELAGASLPVAFLRLGLAVVRARSIHPYRVMAKLNKRGKACRIHPSAVVEGSWLGEGVEVGANAVVRGSLLADGVRVEDNAIVEFSILGPGSVVQRLAMAKFSVLGTRSACAGMLQLGVLGTDSSLKYGATFMDMALGQAVRVKAAGRLFPAPLGIGGVCLGPGAVVGTGVQIAPGRAVPRDLVIVSNPSLVLSRIPTDPSPGTYTVVDGRLEQR